MTVTKAHTEKDVANAYKKKDVAQQYIKERFSFSWSKLLHEMQVTTVKKAVKKYNPQHIVELAPGPARIATDLEPISGTMVEFSEEMIHIAKQRLKANSAWNIIHGNAFSLSTMNLSCDFLYTFRFIRHFKQEERTKLYKEIYNTLSDRGILIFDVVNAKVRQKLENKKEKFNPKIAIHDAIYSKKSFAEEMKNNGFEVISMIPVIHYFSLQSWISYKFDHRIKPFSKLSVYLMEKIPSNQPLEWICICRKE